MSDPQHTQQAGESLTPLTPVLDELIERFSQGPYAQEIVLAKQEYAQRAGKVFEDDPLFEERTAAFLEWYAVERPLSAAGKAPTVVALAGEADPERAQAMRAWATSHRSLFEIRELEDGCVRLQDLVGGARFEVDERRRLFGVSAGEVVESRLVGWRGRVLFGRTFLYHPAQAKDAIVAHVRRIREQGGSRADAVDYVASLRVKAEKYKHVAPERVYETEI